MFIYSRTRYLLTYAIFSQYFLKLIKISQYLLNIKKILHKSCILINTILSIVMSALSPHDRTNFIFSPQFNSRTSFRREQRSRDKSTRVRPCVRKSSQIGDMSALLHTVTTMLVNRHERTVTVTVTYGHWTKAVVNCDHPQNVRVYAVTINLSASVRAKLLVAVMVHPSAPLFLLS